MPWSGVHDRDPRGFRLQKLTEDLNRDQISARKDVSVLREDRGAGGQPLETPHREGTERNLLRTSAEAPPTTGEVMLGHSLECQARRTAPEDKWSAFSDAAGHSGETAKAVRVTEATRTLTREVPGVWAAGSQTTRSETVTGKRH